MRRPVRGILRSFTASALYVKPVPPVSERRENAGYFGEDISGDIFAILSEARHQWKGGVRRDPRGLPGLFSEAEKSSRKLLSKYGFEGFRREDEL
ncbi:hypothetical protein DRO38_05075 [Candidatus Bathyarchaeota archaeon]|nr:MAG: hypothetical protein DRO38_05075 [Candidatus Bathyarchaeota archaeon]